MLTRSLDTIALVDESLRSAVSPSAEQSVAAIESLYLTKGGYTYEQVDQAGANLMQEIFQTVNQAFEKIRMSRISRGGGVQQSGGAYQIPHGYRLPLSGARIVHISLASAVPAQAQSSLVYGLIVPKDAVGDDDIQLLDITKPNSPNVFTARVDELIPAMSGSLRIRLNMFAERIVNELLAELKDKAQASMRNRP